ncbi:transporter [Pandoraea terrae]|uniref:Transporter n=1 Tax=Pandoraea terrae TaxID=1537710 RepID=A0A5E4T307_9BURK|nr:transporter [Pandoraea terrae]VVD82185.1 transporter [Pandoraea terrae]
MKKSLIFASACLPLFAHAMNPLVTDDTGTQDTGNWQYEFSSEWASQPTSRTQEWGSVLTYGVTPALDIALSTPYQRSRNDGESWVSGFSDPQIQAKWRFHESDSWRFGFKPFVSLPLASKDRGLGNGRSTYGGTLLMQYDIGAWTWLGNVGYTRNNNSDDNRVNLWQASTAVLFQATETLRLAFDIGLATNPDRSSSTKPAYALVGAIYSVNKDLDLDIGYKRGLNPQSLQHSVQAGATIRW